MPRILAIETSGRMGSVAIGGGGEVLGGVRLSGDMKHAGELAPAIARVLAERGWAADSLSEVFVSAGPGSFTGLRIGVTIARTLAWSVGVKIVAVPTLDCIARNALAALASDESPTLSPPEVGALAEKELGTPCPPADERMPEHVAVILDAKRGQVFTAAYRLGERTCVRIIDACLADPREFLARCPRPLAVLGEGVNYHREAVAAAGVNVLDERLWPARAENVYYVGLELAAAGRYTPAGELLPLYIRRPEAEEKWEKLHPPPAAAKRPSTPPAPPF